MTAAFWLTKFDEIWAEKNGGGESRASCANCDDGRWEFLALDPMDSVSQLEEAIFTREAKKISKKFKKKFETKI